MQAQSAGVEPDVRMNPVLLKPCSDTGSQVIVRGEVRGQMPAAEYFRYKKQLIPEILEAYESLAQICDVVVVEGAGSPAEINLKQDDIVNMGLARMINAPVLLTGDIDRGGVFAQLYGTVALLEPEERARIGGLVINKFRGDPAILAPGLAMLEEKTRLPVLGVVPFMDLDIDEEDSLAPCLEERSVHKPVDVAVIRLPRLSNFTDFTLWKPTRCWGSGTCRMFPRWDIPTSSFCREPKIPWRICSGCGRMVLKRPSANWLRRAPRFSVSAAATRCWGGHCRIPGAWRAAKPDAHYGASDCCPWTPYSHGRKRAPVYRPLCCSNRLRERSWMDMRSTWETHGGREHRSAVCRMEPRKAAARGRYLVPICMACLILAS